MICNYLSNAVCKILNTYIGKKFSLARSEATRIRQSPSKLRLILNIIFGDQNTNFCISLFLNKHA